MKLKRVRTTEESFDLFDIGGRRAEKVEVVCDWVVAWGKEEPWLLLGVWFLAWDGWCCLPLGCWADAGIAAIRSSSRHAQQELGEERSVGTCRLWRQCSILLELLCSF